MITIDQIRQIDRRAKEADPSFKTSDLIKRLAERGQLGEIDKSTFSQAGSDAIDSLNRFATRSAGELSELFASENVEGAAAATLKGVKNNALAIKETVQGVAADPLKFVEDANIDVADTIISGVTGIPEQVGQLGEAVGKRFGSETVEDAFGQVKEVASNIRQVQGIEERNARKAALPITSVEKIAFIAEEALPFMVVALAGTAALGAAGGLLSSAPTLTATEFDSLKDRTDMSLDEKLTRSFASGLTQAGLETFGAKKLIEAVNTPKIMKFTSKAMKENRWGDVKAVFTAAVNEGETEGLQEVISIAAESNTLDAFFKTVSSKEGVGRIAQSTAAGFGLGGLVTGAGVSVQERTGARNVKATSDAKKVSNLNPLDKSKKFFKSINKDKPKPKTKPAEPKTKKTIKKQDEVTPADELLVDIIDSPEVPFDQKVKATKEITKEKELATRKKKLIEGSREIKKKVKEDLPEGADLEDTVDLHVDLTKEKKIPKVETISVSDQVFNQIIDTTRRISVKAFESSIVRNQNAQVLTSEEEEAAVFLIEKTTVPKKLKRPDLEEIVKDPSPALKERVKAIRKHFNDSWKYLQENLEDLSIEQIENYVTHLWDIPKSKLNATLTWFSTRNGFLKKRFISTFKEGIEKFDLVPKTLNINKIIEIHDNTVARTTEFKKLADDLKRVKDDDGQTIIQRIDLAPPNWELIDHPAFNKTIVTSNESGKTFIKVPVKVHPDVAKRLRLILDHRITLKVGGVDLIKAYEVVNAVLKKLRLTLSAFHHMALGETGIPTIGPVKTAKIYGDAARLYKNFVKKDYDVFKKSEVAIDGIQNGLTLGALSEVHRGLVQDLLDKAAKKTKIAKPIQKANELWDAALWDVLHNNLKVLSYETLVEQEINRLNPQTTEEIKKIKEEQAAFVNDTYGGQEWVRLGVGPKALQVMGWFFLAEDWLVSTVRQGLSFTSFGHVHSRTARARQGTKFALRAGLYFGLGMNFLNYLFTKKDEDEEAKFMWDNDPGHRTHIFIGRYKDGTKKYLRFGKQFREVPELFYDMHNDELSPFATTRKLGGKGSPNLQLASQIITGKTLSRFPNRDLDDETGWQWVGGVMKTIGKEVVPFSLNNVLDDNKEFSLIDFAAPSSKGMTFNRARHFFSRAFIDQDERLFQDTFEAAIGNKINATEAAKSALSEMKREATKKINKAIREDEENFKAKTPKEKQLLKKHLKKLRDTQRVINQWERQMDRAWRNFKRFERNKDRRQSNRRRR